MLIPQLKDHPISNDLCLIFRDHHKVIPHPLRPEWARMEVVGISIRGIMLLRRVSFNSGDHPLLSIGRLLHLHLRYIIIIPTWVDLGYREDWSLSLEILGSGEGE
jgi:hypothetical protein